MDVVVRTPHGQGEISLGAGTDDLTLSALLERVVGHDAPPVIEIDGHAVSRDTLLADAGIVRGSIISTVDTHHDAQPDAVVSLRQLAGNGAGRTVALSPGHYRIGPGRRVSADEFAMAPVDDAVMELRVADDGSVAVLDRRGVVLVGGPTTSNQRWVPWGDEPLAVSGRILELGRPGDAHHDGAAERSDVGAMWSVPRRPSTDGVIAFHRPPRASLPRNRWSMAPNPSDIATMAATRSPHLWQRRPSDPDAYRIPVGLQLIALDRNGSPRAATDGHRLEPISLALSTDRGAGVVGGSDFTRGVTRGLLVAAAAIHGPADLSIAVATTPDHLADWEWVKWLPHAQLAGGAGILTDDAHVRAWASRLGQGSPGATAPMALLAVDHEDYWQRRDGPIRTLLVDDTGPIRFLALTRQLHDVPSACSTVISERSQATAHVEVRNERRRYDDVRTFLVTEALATQVARHLAALDDMDIVGPSAAASPAPTLIEVHQLGGEVAALTKGGSDVAATAPTMSASDIQTAIERRWAAATSTTMPIRFGIGADGPARIDMAADAEHVLVHGAGANDVVTGAVIGMAAEIPPDRLDVIVLSPNADGTLLDRLPHVRTRVRDIERHRARRIVRALRAEAERRRRVLDGAGVADIAGLQTSGTHDALARASMARVLIVVFDADRIDDAAPSFLDDLLSLDGIGTPLGLHLLVATGAAELLPVDVRTRFAVDVAGPPPESHARSTEQIRPSLVATLRHGRASDEVRLPDIWDRRRDQSAEASEATEASITPFVVGRELTPIEKRLVRTQRAGRPTASPGPDVVALLRAIDTAATSRDSTSHGLPALPPALLPELPEHLDAEDFFDTHPGEGVPYGLADLAHEQRQAPVWWQPGPGQSIVAYGSARSRASSLLTTLVLGAARRIAADDVQIHAISVDGSALAALQRLDHVASVLSAAAHRDLGGLVVQLTDEFERRRALIEPGRPPARVAADEPAIVVMIDDVGSCRRRLDDVDRTLWVRLEDVLVHAEPLGLSSVIVVRRPDELPSRLAGSIATHLALQLTDDGYDRLGLTGADIPPALPGRAVRLRDRAPVQLASPPVDIAAAIAGLAAGGTEQGARR